MFAVYNKQILHDMPLKAKTEMNLQSLEDWQLLQIYFNIICPADANFLGSSAQL